MQAGDGAVRRRRGSMTLAEQQDPEEWRKIMQRFFSILADMAGARPLIRGPSTVHRRRPRGRLRGSSPTRITATRLLAPPERCSRASPVSGRVGKRPASTSDPGSRINSGEVVAGAIAPGARASTRRSAIRSDWRSAWRALAEPGKAYLTGAHRRLAAAFGPGGPGRIRDQGCGSRPVQVFELAGVGAACSRLDLAHERGFSRFVGPRRRDGCARGGAGAGQGRARRAVRPHRRRAAIPPLPRVRPTMPPGQGH